MKIKRPPVIVIMGHVDHGKSTLLDYIRKSKVAEKEIGGITQRVGAYEIEYAHENTNKRITFIDTPGHESFQSIRARGALIADIAILVVSAEDGVKPQTIQALKTIQKEDMPYIVAINKIDKNSADIEKTKQNLAENEIYVEGYGGNIPFVGISAITGQGIPELLDMILLIADLEDLQADTDVPGSGIVIETHVDKRKGNTATLIIKDGTIKSGQAIVAGYNFSPVRIFEDFSGKTIKEATFSSPVRIIGWDALPSVGETFTTVKNKQEAERIALENKNALSKNKKEENKEEKGYSLPIIIKANETGGLEAVIHEIAKIKHDSVNIKIVHQGVGDISEYDVKTGGSIPETLIIGFGVNIDNPAKAIADSQKINIYTFDIIYKLSEWLNDIVKKRAPKNKIEKMTGRAKILKAFSKNKDKQILGGRVEEGTRKVGEEVKIFRRENEIGRGYIKELQKQKEKASEIEEGKEFGSMIESKIEMVPGDRIECFIIIEE